TKNGLKNVESNFKNVKDYKISLLAISIAYPEAPKPGEERSQHFIAVATMSFQFSQVLHPVGTESQGIVEITQTSSRTLRNRQEFQTTSRTPHKRRQELHINVAKNSTIVKNSREI
ncbi:2540_t:CDS:2, partial [Cetraspora pellucida]